jgi:hypothetical protein
MGGEGASRRRLLIVRRRSVALSLGSVSLIFSAFEMDGFFGSSRSAGPSPVMDGKKSI